MLYGFFKPGHIFLGSVKMTPFVAIVPKLEAAPFSLAWCKHAPSMARFDFSSPWKRPNICSLCLVAARLQQSTAVKNKDIRKFLDGIYVSEKTNIVVSED